jgi:hypothetical protein
MAGRLERTGHNLHWIREQGLVACIHSVLDRCTLRIDLLFVPKTNFTIKEDVVRVHIVDDGDGMIITVESAPKWDPLFTHPAAGIARVKDDGILVIAEADMQHNVFALRDQVESGAAGGAKIEFTGMEGDSSTRSDFVIKPDRGIAREDVKLIHGKLRNSSWNLSVVRIELEDSPQRFGVDGISEERRCLFPLFIQVHVGTCLLEFEVIRTDGSITFIGFGVNGATGLISPGHFKLLIDSLF